MGDGLGPHREEFPGRRRPRALRTNIVPPQTSTYDWASRAIGATQVLGLTETPNFQFWFVPGTNIESCIVGFAFCHGGVQAASVISSAELTFPSVT
jgi:hypothetical protein